ncbi:hypothetical protein NBRC116188_05220 [Oceaniserpentilla sp. 4NH20-0058]|uniref:hypothetical protein n=1 Tax=Oceaniserpentilla sp. 4NH20-0058 TaxID=3127660 RepID=UPI0031059BCE
MDIKPDWNQVALNLEEKNDEESLNGRWALECHKWLKVVADHFGGDYTIKESDNFFIMSNESDRYVNVFSIFLERTLDRILKALDEIASDEGYGKHAVMIFKNIDHYYEYVNLFYPDEGEFGLSSGMYINDGYGHFAFPSQDISYSEPIAVHEMTHACLSHLSIPTWLNEGLAVVMEDVLAGNSLFLDNEIMARHNRYWNSQTINDFWSGDAFYGSDDGQELSYNLAHILVKKMSSDYDSFKNFVNHASYEDAGEKACKSNLGYSLHSFVGSFLGDGDWIPTTYEP